MTRQPRKRALTAQIKPEPRNAIMDQLALAASEIERLRGEVNSEPEVWADGYRFGYHRWWHRLMWWRA